MKYKLPPDSECIDLLTDAEYDACRNDREALAKGRRKARERALVNGPTNRLRDLAHGSVGDSVLFTEYTRTPQVGAMLNAVSLSDGVRFASKLERSLIDGSVVGVRVTLTEFTR